MVQEEYKGIDSKFRLVIFAARRAKQLINGDRKKIDIKAENPLTVAIEELRQNVIDFPALFAPPTLFLMHPEEALAGSSPAEDVKNGETDKTAGEEKDQPEPEA
jgi:DNA-directed RNA polymerase omega subunit